MLIIIAMTILLAIAPTAAALPETNGQTDLAQRIKTRIVSRNDAEGFVCGAEPVCGLKLIPLFYAARDFQAAWTDGSGPGESAKALLQAIRTIDEDGLRPGDYHLSGIERLISLLEKGPDQGREHRLDILADLDLLLTDAFLLWGSHLSAGRVNPETVHNDWLISERSVDLLPFLTNVVEKPHKTIEAVLPQLRPDHAYYHRLRRALSDLRRMAGNGGWSVVPIGATIRPGDQDTRVPAVRRRLLLSADLTSDSPVPEPQRYDGTLETAVKRFQQRHGLESDGLIGRRTLNALNVSIQQRIRQVKLNLERQRWLPHDLGNSYLLVNTADFKLRAVENQVSVFDMRVVVGRPARRSPVFSSRMTYLVLNPYWTVPFSIAVKDILPRLKNGEDYLTKQGFRVFNGWNEDAEEIDPHLIDWTFYSQRRFPFRLRQDPGPANALGRIKFMFPNKFAVYLHDTPQRNLFNRAQRDFSSGCIRVEDALGLAQYVLKEDPAWTRTGIEQALTAGRNQVVRLKTPVIIHLIYMTAWVDPDGSLQFREDIYDRDSKLDHALQALPAGATHMGLRYDPPIPNALTDGQFTHAGHSN